MAVLGLPRVTSFQNLLLPGPCFQLTCAVTPVASQAGGTGLAAYPRNAVHIREALFLTGILGAFTVVAEGVLITPAAGHLKWVAGHWAVGSLTIRCSNIDPSALGTRGPKSLLNSASIC